MTKKFGLAVGLILVIAVCAYASPVSINGKLHVNGLQLVSSCGNPVQLRGVSTHGISWFGSCYTDTLMDYVANTMHADVFRIAMYTAVAGGYISNPPSNTAMVQDLVAKCVARGMYAIIDWHILSDNDPNTYKTQAGDFFTAMATQYKNTPNVMYEICNEPNGGAVTWAVISNYANYVIPKIRAVDPNALIIVGTPNWSQLGADVVANPLSYSNIMYTFHFYAGTHNTGMLTPYVNSLPIFCTEWGASNSSGNGGDNYANAQSFLNIMGGANTAGVKISWASWSLADNTDTSSMLTAGTCGTQNFSLSTAGNFVKNNAMTPGKTFLSCGTATATITGTPPTQTITPTITDTSTITQTPTPYPFILIYDGDTAGATLADGTATSNFEHNAPAPTPMGTISEVASGGNPNKAMKLTYTNPAYWESHQWTFPSVTVGLYNHIMLDVKASSGTVSKLMYRPDNTLTGANIVDLNVEAGGIVNYAWRTVLIPLNRLYSTPQTSIDTLRFADNTGNNYSVLIDNVKLVMVASFTTTPTYTITPTISATFTITQTHTVSPTITPSPTFVAGLVFKDHYTYPNPFKGDKVTFRYTHEGFAETVKIKIFTYSDRKIAEVMDSNKYGDPFFSETVWVPPYRLGNGLYYYIIELTRGEKKVAGKIGTFVILRQ